MRYPKPESYRTFTCDLDGCDNTRKVHKHNFDRAINHYCSRECVFENMRRRKKAVIAKPKVDKKDAFRAKWDKMKWRLV